MDRLNGIAGTRGKAWGVFHIAPAGGAVTVEMLKALSAVNLCSTSFMMAGIGEHIWFFRHYSPHTGQKSCIIPDAWGPTTMDYYSFHKQGRTLQKQAEAFVNAASAATCVLGNVQARRREVQQFTRDELCNHVSAMSLRTFNETLADADLAIMYKHVTPLQVAVLKIKGYLGEFLEAKLSSDNCVVHMDAVKARYPRDFAAGIGDLPGRLLDPVTMKIGQCTLDEVITTGLSLERFIWFIGRNASGKTTLAKAVARRSCIGAEVDTFVLTGTYDAVGLLTRSKLMENQGVLILWLLGLN